MEILDGLINNSLNLLIESMRDSDLCQLTTQIIQKYVETFLKGEALITEFESRLGDMVASVLNGSESTPVSCLKQLLEDWQRDYDEDSVLHDAFRKFISKVVKKAITALVEDSQKGWLANLFSVDLAVETSRYD